ncbi:MAG: NADH-quinone oxidoreductase subunit C [Verrucomicrobia bacterium]|nr:MAG: NADH-quinone oxidoreductase subunit C [Verrucomicrobiota bacterium]
MSACASSPTSGGGASGSLPSLEALRDRLLEAVPGAQIQIQPNPAVPEQSSLVVDPAHAVAVARYLRDAEDLRLDYCSNVTGVDWLDAFTEETVTRTRVVEGREVTVEETIRHRRPGYLEVVYHLYSMSLRHGPVILRQRTRNRVDDTRVASLTPVWRSAEFQEREVYDLFGVQFEGHPDLRRILMWDEFADHPMRKDYVEPDDYEYEPTPNAEILPKARRHYPLEGTA